MSAKIAIVIPWFGKDQTGGAEQHAWQVAKRLHARGVAVTTLTTCSKSFHDDWGENFHPAGEQIEDGIRVVRFKLDQRDPAAFNRAVGTLLAMEHASLVPGLASIAPKTEKTYLAENINSFPLLKYVSEHQADFDAFLFIPYLFPTSIRSVKLAGPKAVLVPCLHDECYAYLDSVRESFQNCARVFFNSPGEQNLACSLYGPWLAQKSVVAGAGVEHDTRAIESGTVETPVEGEYILCLGRKCVEKNSDLLVRAFDKFVKRTGSKLRLAFAGPGDLPVRPVSDRVLDLGFVSDAVKAALLRNCKALVSPSVNESFSRTIFEAWFAGKPVLVHTSCPATSSALADSGSAGWSANSPESFVKALTEIDAASEALCRELGEKGQAYARKAADWDTVINRFITEIERLKRDNEKLSVAAEKVAVAILAHTVGETCVAGRNALHEALALSDAGFDTVVHSEVFATDRAVRWLDAQALTNAVSARNTLAVFHWAPGWDKGAALFEQLKTRKVVRWLGGGPLRDVADFCKRARPDLILCDSQHSARLLAGAIERDSACIQVVPPFAAFSEFARAGLDLPLFEKLNDARVNLLVDGQPTPDSLRVLFDTARRHRDQYGRQLRLCFAGRDGRLPETWPPDVPADLQDSVFRANGSSMDEVHAYYRACDVFVLLPGEPTDWPASILDAQFTGLPVVAQQHGPAAEVAGTQQVVLPDLNADLLASAVHVLVSDEAARDFVIREGYRNTLQYTRGALAQRFLAALRLVP